MMVASYCYSLEQQDVPSAVGAKGKGAFASPRAGSNENTPHRVSLISPSTYTLMRLTPPPSARDYSLNLDDTEGLAQLFDIDAPGFSAGFSGIGGGPFGSSGPSGSSGPFGSSGSFGPGSQGGGSTWPSATPLGFASSTSGSSSGAGPGSGSGSGSGPGPAALSGSTSSGSGGSLGPAPCVDSTHSTPRAPSLEFTSSIASTVSGGLSSGCHASSVQSTYTTATTTCTTSTTQRAPMPASPLAIHSVVSLASPSGTTSRSPLRPPSRTSRALFTPSEPCHFGGLHAL